MPTQKEIDKERLKKIEQDKQARIKAQDDAKKADREEKKKAFAAIQVKNQEKSDAEKNKLQAMATRMDLAIGMIVRRVKKLRKKHPDKKGLNAGDEHIPGGAKNPLEWDSSILQLMDHRDYYTGSWSTGVKFAIPVKDQDNVLIHLKSV
jgi:hypothetical protein